MSLERHKTDMSLTESVWLVQCWTTLLFWQHNLFTWIMSAPVIPCETVDNLIMPNQIIYTNRCKKLLAIYLNKLQSPSKLIEETKKTILFRTAHSYQRYRYLVVNNLWSSYLMSFYFVRVQFDGPVFTHFVV